MPIFDLASWEKGEEKRLNIRVSISANPRITRKQSYYHMKERVHS